MRNCSQTCLDEPQSFCPSRAIQFSWCKLCTLKFINSLWLGIFYFFFGKKKLLLVFKELHSIRLPYIRKQAKTSASQATAALRVLHIRIQRCKQLEHRGCPISPLSHWWREWLKVWIVCHQFLFHLLLLFVIIFGH
jgi:hypothetical protein